MVDTPYDTLRSHSKYRLTKGLAMANISFDIHETLARLEKGKARRYSYAEIAKISGLTRQGARRLLKERTERIDLVTLGKLLDFFAAEGMPIAISDLFTVVS